MTDEQELDYKCIVFHVQDEEYIIPVNSIGSIERMLPITRVPSVASYVKGVINLRGIVIPVIDVEERFFQKETEFTEQSRIIIVHHNDLTVGLIVGAANDVVDILPENIEATPDVVGAEKVEYIKGVVQMNDHLYILLDLDNFLSKDGLNHVIAMEG